LTEIGAVPRRGGVKPRAGGDPLDRWVVRQVDEAGRHDRDRQPVARCDAIDLVLHRAGVGVDMDVHQIVGCYAAHI